MSVSNILQKVNDASTVGPELLGLAGDTKVVWAALLESRLSNALDNGVSLALRATHALGCAPVLALAPLPLASTVLLTYIHFTESLHMCSKKGRFSAHHPIPLDCHAAVELGLENGLTCVLERYPDGVVLHQRGRLVERDEEPVVAWIDDRNDDVTVQYRCCRR